MASKTVAVLGIVGRRDDWVVPELPEDGVVLDPDEVVPEEVGVVVEPEDVEPVEVGMVVVVVVVGEDGVADGVVTAGVEAAREFVVIEPPQPIRANAGTRIRARKAFRIVLP